MEQNPLQKTRIEVVDALRGFAVMATFYFSSLSGRFTGVVGGSGPRGFECGV